ncbi:MAG: RsfS/YbeB/iojap family protein [Flavobacteriales bacterium]
MKPLLYLDLKNKEYTICDYFIIYNGNHNNRIYVISRLVEQLTSKQLQEKSWHL